MGKRLAITAIYLETSRMLNDTFCSTLKIDTNSKPKRKIQNGVEVDH